MANNLDKNWCKNPDSGLPKPHLVLFMNISPERAAERSGFGEELYEKLDFQKKVYDHFLSLKEENWVLINADQPVELVTKEIIAIVSKFLKENPISPLEKLWPLSN